MSVPSDSARPSTGRVVAIAGALAESPALARLSERLRESQARYATALPCLPIALRPHVVPGPVDERGWCLLADSAAIAAKLRQLLPDVSACLAQAGWPALKLRIRVLQR